MNNEWLNLQYLSYALEVEKTGSISKAAENLYMSQPNLSKAVKELETMIGVSIFDRTTKGVSATTEDGRIFLEYAKNILAQFNDMKSYFQTANDKRNIFCISVPGASYISEAFYAFIDSIADTESFCITFKETNSLDAIKSVTELRYNLAVIRYRTADENFFLSLLADKELESEVLLESESIIIMSEKSKLADTDKKILELSDFCDMCDMTEIVGDDFSIPRQLTAERNISDFSPPIKKQIFIYERGIQFDLLSGNPNMFMRTSPVPESVLRKNSLVQKKYNIADAELKFKDVLIYKKGHTFDEFEKIFIDNIDTIKKFILSSL